MAWHRQGAAALPPALPTPHYRIDETRLLANMQRIARLRELSGARVLLGHHHTDIKTIVF